MAELQNINLNNQNFDFSGVEYSSLSQPYWNYIFNGGCRHMYATRIEPDPSLQYYNVAFESQNSAFIGDLYMVTSRRGNARPRTAQFRLGGYFENDINYNFNLNTVYNSGSSFGISYVESFPGSTYSEVDDNPKNYSWTIFKFQFNYATSSNLQIINLLLDVKWSEFSGNKRAASFFYN